MSPRPRFRVVGKTVIDEASSLVWTREPVTSTAKFKDAAEQCRKLSLDGVRGFRVPGRAELETLIDTRRRNPAIDAQTFVVLPHEIDWSGTATTDSAQQGWVVALDDGQNHRDDFDVLHSVRCAKTL
jgi:hypothetical protein